MQGNCSIHYAVVLASLQEFLMLFVPFLTFRDESVLDIPWARTGEVMESISDRVKAIIRQSSLGVDDVVNCIGSFLF